MKGWRKHSILHHTDYKVIQEGCTDKRDIDYNWTLLSENSTYSPTPLDVGCILRVEVHAIATSPAAEENTVLCGPFNHYTEGVLSAPKAPPRRQIGSGNKNMHNSNSQVQFRLVSYNILAELYATKSVSYIYIYICILLLYIYYNYIYIYILLIISIIVFCFM